MEVFHKDLEHDVEQLVKKTERTSDEGKDFQKHSLAISWYASKIINYLNKFNFFDCSISRINLDNDSVDSVANAIAFLSRSELPKRY